MVKNKHKEFQQIYLRWTKIISMGKPCHSHMDVLKDKNIPQVWLNLIRSLIEFLMKIK